MTKEHKQKIGKANKGHIVSQETKKKISISKRGKPNNSSTKFGKGSLSPRWKDGRSSEREKIRGSFQYQLWRRAVIERDSYKCIWCESTEKLEVDHIKPFSLYPELRFAIDNGRTLCQVCHKTTDTYGYKLLTMKYEI